MVTVTGSRLSRGERHRLARCLEHDLPEFLRIFTRERVTNLHCEIVDDDEPPCSRVIGSTLYVHQPLHAVARVLGLQDGARVGNSIVLLPTLVALLDAGAFEDDAWCALRAFAEKSIGENWSCLEGRLWGAFKTLELEGWVQLEGAGETTQYRLTSRGRSVVAVFAHHRAVVESVVSSMGDLAALHSSLRILEPSEMVQHRYQALCIACAEGWGLRAPEQGEESDAIEEARSLLDGVLLASTLVALSMPVCHESGPYLKVVEPAVVAGGNVSLGTAIDPLDVACPLILETAFNLLVRRGWLHRMEEDGRLVLTAAGHRAFQLTTPIAALVGSYMKTYAQLPQHLFDPESEMGISEDRHIDRLMNVFGTSRASSVPAMQHMCNTHLRDIFDRLPLEQQPAGIADMGCGDGRALETMARFIIDSTERGRHLAEFPLVVLGADFYEGPLRRTSAQLSPLEELEGVMVRVVRADVGDPDGYDQTVRSLDLARARADGGSLGIRDFVHTFMFLIHNRRLKVLDRAVALSLVEKCLQEPGRRQRVAGVLQEFFASTAPTGDHWSDKDWIEGVGRCFSGTYVVDGAAISGMVVAADLIEFLEVWRPYVPFGMLAVEGHIPTHNHGKDFPLPPYPQPHPFRWGMHYISEQYLFSFREYLLVLALAGFSPYPAHGYGRLYPEGFPLSSDESPANRSRSVVRIMSTAGSDDR